MLTNTTITIFNRFPEKETKTYIYIPRILKGVWFHTDYKAKIGENGLYSADEYKIRIPYHECREWVPEQVFRQLKEPRESWTVQNGDIFLVGVWDGGMVKGIDEIKRKFSGTVGKVLSHSENFFGSSKHIRIGGGS